MSDGLRHLGVGWQALPALAEEIGAPYPEVWSLAHTITFDRIEADPASREWVFTSRDGTRTRREPFGYLGLGEAEEVTP